MFVAAAFCPHPPVLVPEASGPGTAELDAVRAACWQAVARVLRAGPDVVWVVGAGPRTAAFPQGAAGSLREYGVDARHCLGPDAGGAPELPLALTVGAWLIEDLSVPVRGQSVAPSTDRAECQRLGARLAGLHERSGLVVMGDHPGDDLDGYADAVADALGTADLDGVADLPPDAGEPGRSGWAAWQVAAGAASAATGPGRELRGSLVTRQAQYGVSYVVATWELEEGPA